MRARGMKRRLGAKYRWYVAKVPGIGSAVGQHVHRYHSDFLLRFGFSGRTCGIRLPEGWSRATEFSRRQATRSGLRGRRSWARRCCPTRCSRPWTFTVRSESADGARERDREMGVMRCVGGCGARSGMQPLGTPSESIVTPMSTLASFTRARSITMDESITVAPSEFIATNKSESADTIRLESITAISITAALTAY